MCHVTVFTVKAVYNTCSVVTEVVMTVLISSLHPVQLIETVAYRPTLGWCAIYMISRAN